jgi:plasmid stability protein
MATLTLRNVPDELVARLKARDKRHRRSLNNETIAALELADGTLTAATPPLAAATMAPDWKLPWPGSGRFRPVFLGQPTLPTNPVTRRSCRRNLICLPACAVNSRALRLPAQR